MIQWFPGHMAKTRRIITENIKLVDVVVELGDARLPISSRNPLLDELIGMKPRLLILTKRDLADENMTRLWLKTYQEKGLLARSDNFLRGTKQFKKEIYEQIRNLAKEVLAKRKQKGIISQTVRTMVVGIPNVGKSTFVNVLVGKSKAETGDRPGVTKGKQWLRLTNDIELLDTPGILWPKFEDELIAKKLAATGAISDNVFDKIELTLWLLNWLVKNYPGQITARYKVEEVGTPLELLAEISNRRGFLVSGGKADLHKGSIIVLDEFRSGKIGNVTLDQPEMEGV